jgi:tetratricopeptide (TPR) repeat protein
MTRARLVSLALLAAGLGIASLPSPSLVPSAAAEGLRPEIGKPLEAAKELVKKGNAKAAMEEINKAAAVGNKTAFENLTIEQMRAYVAQQAGDTAAAIKAYEALIAAGGTEGKAQLSMVQTIALLYLQEKDYPKAISWLLRYRKDGGTDPAMRTQLIQTYFDSKDFAAAAKEQQDQIAGEEKAKEIPPEAQYQLLLNCFLGQNDSASYVAVLEKVVLHYPKPEYWVDLLRRSSTKPGFAASRLGLDLFRLKLATGTMKNGDDYREMTQTALQERFPGEAKDVIDKAFAAGLMGKDEKAVRDNKLRDLVMATVGTDMAAIDVAAATATEAKDGQAMLNVGFDYVGYGQFDKGIKLMEDGIKAGGEKHPDDGKLHLGLAYLRAGQKPKAVQMLKTVEGTDGTSDLARLWLLVNDAKPAS